MRLAILALLCCTTPLIAQTESDELVIVGEQIVCMNSKQLEKLTSDFDELPVFRALSTRTDGVTPSTYSLVMFYNPDEKTYTMFEKRDKDLYCVISVGNGLEYIDPNEYKKPRT